MYTTSASLLSGHSFAYRSASGCDPPYCSSAHPTVARGCGTRPAQTWDPCWHTAAPTPPDTPAGGRSCRRCGNRADELASSRRKRRQEEKCPATKRKRSKNDVWRLLPLFVPVSAPCFALRAVA